MSKKRRKVMKPKTKLKFKELLGKRPIADLAEEMGVTYTQLYPYKKPGANPTLLVLEQMASGLTKILGEEVTLGDLLGLETKRTGRGRN